ncbi:MAG: serine protease [Desulforhopalus sp.]|nr:serine protease [Desulforhopalus sp.]
MTSDLDLAIDYAVIGPHDSRTHEIRTTRFPFNTICHVERDFGDGIWRGCSGTLIGPQKVLCAGHCLYNHRLKRAPVRIRISPGRADRDTRPYGSIMVLRSYVPRRYVHPRTVSDLRNYDYGLAILPQPFKGLHTFMEVRALSNAQLEKMRHQRLISIAGYPADRPVGTLWRHSERLTRTGPRRLYYTVDTCPGHSGSSIWFLCPRHARRHVIGVHTSGPIDEAGRAFGCSPGTVFAPQGFMNSGVRITDEVLANINNPARKVGGVGKMIRFP